MAALAESPSGFTINALLAVLSESDTLLGSVLLCHLGDAESSLAWLSPSPPSGKPVALVLPSALHFWVLLGSQSC